MSGPGIVPLYVQAGVAVPGVSASAETLASRAISIVPAAWLRLGVEGRASSRSQPSGWGEPLPPGRGGGPPPGGRRPGAAEEAEPQARAREAEAPLDQLPARCCGMTSTG